MNSKTFTLVVIFLGLLLAALITRRGDLAWMALPFLVYLGIGLWLAPEAGEMQLQAERQINKDGSDKIQVQVIVRNLGAPIARLHLSDRLPEDVTIIDGQASQWTMLDQGQEAVLHYAFQARRGVFNWENLQAVASDPLSLLEVAFELPAVGSSMVQPSYARFQRLSLRPNSTLHSPGSIPARLAGSGTDFWGVREYHPGDSLRWLDWKLTARHPRQFFTREFEQEEIADIGLILDARQKVYLRVGSESLFEHSVEAAASLAETFIHQGHRMSLMAMGETLHLVYPGYGKVQLNRIFRCLARLKPGDNFNSLDRLPLHMYSSHAPLVVISPLIQQDEPFFPRLKANGYQALVISPNPFQFIAASMPQDRISQLAWRTASLRRRLELLKIARLNFPVIDWPVEQNLYPYVRRALAPGRGDFR